MKNRSELDLANLSVEELMEGLEAVAPPASDSVSKWVEAEGIFPGSTRVQAKILYDKYRIWLGANPEAGSDPGIRNWGKLMSDKFKKGRARGLSHYYISRESLSDLVAKFPEAGPGPGGRGDPGGGEG